MTQYHILGVAEFIPMRAVKELLDKAPPGDQISAEKGPEIRPFNGPPCCLLRALIREIVEKPPPLPNLSIELLCNLRALHTIPSRLVAPHPEA